MCQERKKLTISIRLTMGTVGEDYQVLPVKEIKVSEDFDREKEIQWLKTMGALYEKSGKIFTAGYLIVKSIVRGKRKL